MLFGLLGKQRRFRTDVAFASECGFVRRENQDNVVVDPKTLVFCVADGMGGGEAGGEASASICRNVDSALHERASFADRVRLVATVESTACATASFVSSRGTIR